MTITWTSGSQIAALPASENKSDQLKIFKLKQKNLVYPQGKPFTVSELEENVTSEDDNENSPPPSSKKINGSPEQEGISPVDASIGTENHEMSFEEVDFRLPHDDPTKKEFEQEQSLNDSNGQQLDMSNDSTGITMR